MEWLDKNSTAVIAALAALASALIAGGFALLGAWLNNKQNNERLFNQMQHEIGRENRKIFIEKGEELYVAINAWNGQAQAHFIAELKLVKGEISKQQMRALLEGYPIHESFSRIETLTSLYFPELYDNLLIARDYRAQAYRAVDVYEAKNSEKENSLKAIARSHVQFDQATSDFQVALQGSILNQIKK